MSPIFDWVCNDCGHEFEFRKNSGVSMMRCIRCAEGEAFKTVPKKFGYRRDKTIHGDD